MQYPDLQIYRNISGIYELSINNKIYIGSSINLAKRLWVHLNSLKKNKHENTHLQRLVNKYGIDNLSYRVLRTYNDILYDDLLSKEKEFIDNIPKTKRINQKLDPQTQNNCISTSTPIYQFDLYGNFIAGFPSMMEAQRCLNISACGIRTAIKNPGRQRTAGGFLWSDSMECKTKKLIYVYDLYGNKVGEFSDTLEIHEKLFPEKVKKSTISRIKKVLPTTSRYGDFIFSYKELDSNDSLFDRKTIYQFDLNGTLLKIWDINDAFIKANFNRISYNLRGKNKSYKGYYWSYINKFEYLSKRPRKSINGPSKIS
jgi:hypothetical protein